MARISDAREGVKDPARVGMLNIWDVKSLGEDVLREGGRYLVSRLGRDAKRMTHWSRFRTSCRAGRVTGVCRRQEVV